MSILPPGAMWSIAISVVRSHILTTAVQTSRNFLCVARGSGDMVGPPLILRLCTSSSVALLSHNEQYRAGYSNTLAREQCLLLKATIYLNHMHLATPIPPHRVNLTKVCNQWRPRWHFVFNWALHPSGVAKSSTSFGWGKGGNVTSAGWQVTLCDPIMALEFP